LHTQNYSWRTIAHNALLVHDPAEKFHDNASYGNDGGQRFPNRRSEARTLEMLLDPQRGYRTGKVISHGFGPSADTPDYTLLQGDITDAYSQKVRAVTRSFVFLNLHDRHIPAALIVFDRIVSADPAFHKFWLLHTLEEPQINGTTVQIDRREYGGSGRLNVDVVLPEAANARLEKVGGSGKEFWVFGKNYTNDLPAGTLDRTSKEPGAWRIELSPKHPAAEDLLLTVMQTTKRETPARWPVQRMEATDRVGCVISGPEIAWVVLLRKDNTRSGARVEFSHAGQTRARFLITDLAAGRWQAKRTGSTETHMVEVGADSGAGWFEGAAGTWTVVREN
jgi:heparin/heparan-sulfate lyase